MPQHTVTVEPEQLRALLQRLGVTQRELARLLLRERRTIRRWMLRGVPPSLDAVLLGELALLPAALGAELVRTAATGRTAHHELLARILGEAAMARASRPEATDPRQETLPHT